ncbi:hypothetical protein CC2G_004723 [Coprinopsis cinerea AmutBmut pab1-1]|nr:hypothetical protein CC2G_004723 [Coprinopsis cinerea AmutBmut pab1-1]
MLLSEQAHHLSINGGTFNDLSSNGLDPLPIQPNQLIIEPFRKIPSLENYKSVVIDALDQCIGPEGVNKEQGQSLVLQFIQTLVIAQLLTILLCSRQEKWIEEALEELPHLSGNMERFASDSREWNYVKP